MSSLPEGFLRDVVFSLADSTERTQCVRHVMYKVGANRCQ